MRQSLGFNDLPPYQARQFVPADSFLQDAQSVEKFFLQLIDRGVTSTEEFERWILDCSELAAVLDQEGSIRYIRMTCDTGCLAFVEDYKNFIQDILPVIKPLEDQLNQKFLELNKKISLDANRYRVFERNVHADVDLFHPENVGLERDLQLLAQDYQSICGAMTVHMDGREQTMPEMAAYQLEIDRRVREQAWRLTAERRMKDAGRLEECFNAMLGLRHTVARNAGFANFTDYQFLKYRRFDYRPEHCKRYHDAVKKCVIPVWNKILKKRCAQLKLPALRPWDLSVDPLGAPPLKPFADVAVLIAGAQSIFDRIDPVFGKSFQEMASHGLLDLASRKGKAAGGYQNTLTEARQPFIFMNAVGLDADVRTLLHEGGHAFHSLACAQEPLHAYRHPPIEFCEVASMSMELLGNQFLDVFYQPDDAARSIRNHLEGIIYILAWVANIDAFQHWIYEHPDHTQQERYDQWVELYTIFSAAEVDWSGLECYREILWHRQLHLFEVPFYYIEYGIAQLGALQIWKNAGNDWKGSLQKYKNALALGGSRTLPELFATAGLDFDFSEKTIAPLVDQLQHELGLEKDG